MKNFLGQLGKAICYFLLFLGAQVAATTMFSFVYGMKVGMQSAANGTMPDAEALTQGAMEFMNQNMNMILIVSGCLTILILWVFFLSRKKNLFAETGIRAFPVKYVPVIAVLGIGMVAVVTFVMGMLPEEMLEAYAEESQVITGADEGITLMVVISNMIIAPVVEEMIFRGLILSRLKRAVPVVWAVLISALIFGLAHGQIVWIAYAFVLGIVLGIVTVKTESVAAAIVLHVVFNIFGTVIPMLCEDCTVPVMAVIAAVGAVAVAVTLGVIVKKPFHKKAENEAVTAA